MSIDTDELCCTLDNLTLDMLTLIEKHVEHRMDLENLVAEGNFQLAKARYIMGQANVSELQLPNDNSSEFTSVVKITETEDNETLSKIKLDVDINRNYKKDDSDKVICEENASVVNPLNWFGVLVPQSLRMAQKKFMQACYSAVEGANVQNELREVCIKILQLRDLKTTSQEKE